MKQTGFRVKGPVSFVPGRFYGDRKVYLTKDKSEIAVLRRLPDSHAEEISIDGLIQKPVDKTMVYVSATKYHFSDCVYADSLLPMNIEDAKKAGLVPCGLCSKGVTG